VSSGSTPFAVSAPLRPPAEHVVGPACPMGLPTAVYETWGFRDTLQRCPLPAAAAGLAGARGSRKVGTGKEGLEMSPTAESHRCLRHCWCSLASASWQMRAAASLGLRSSRSRHSIEWRDNPLLRLRGAEEPILG